MRYRNIVEGCFLVRPNRFIAHVDIGGRREVAHVKNTGRCRELLLPGARVYLEENRSPSRKTAYDLVAVEKGERLINMDSQAPNKVFAEWAREDFCRVSPRSGRSTPMGTPGWILPWKRPGGSIWWRSRV